MSRKRPETNLSDLRAKFQSLTAEGRENLLRSLKQREIDIFYNHPELFLYDKQIPPTSNWRYHWFRAGRGTGKTFASTSWLASKVLQGATEVGIVGPTHTDLEKEIIPVFLSHFQPKDISRWKMDKKNGIYTTHTGCLVKVYSSQYEIRGANLEYAIAEEMCKWCDCLQEKITERFNLLDLAVRNKNVPNPQIFIASTPKPYQWFIEFDKRARIDLNPRYSMVIGHTDDNPFLSEQAKLAFHEAFEGSRTGRQELYAELLTDIPGALFERAWIDDNRIPRDVFDGYVADHTINIKEIHIGVDPAVSSGRSSDLTGLSVVAFDFNHHMYVLQDETARYTPDAWARQVRNLYREYRRRYGCKVLIVAEVNQGGDLVVNNLVQADQSLRPMIKTIHASKGKLLRAEPVAAKYQRGKVHHIGEFPTLELQMVTYTGDRDQGSPDNMDALVHAINYSIIAPKQPRRDLSPLSGW